ncbi:uncharacterized protein LOC143690306 [Tamandua tetradactyla]|uniref:uncharacterized protein LOC143690306 n=1 Tax=Tamandua tetradactyla TaxID=48850 RepID=UPI004053842D
MDCACQLANIIINKVTTTSAKFNRKICQQNDGTVTKITRDTEWRLLLKVERQSCADRLSALEPVQPKEANNEGAEEGASARRVISQPQMLDKSKEAEPLLDDIQKGRSDCLEEKSLPIILSKVHGWLAVSPALLIQ